MCLSLVMNNNNISDLCISCIPLQEDIDKDTLYKFLNLIHKPCCFPEKVLHEIAETKARMENFEKSNDKIEDTHVHKCIVKRFWLFFYYYLFF